MGERRALSSTFVEQCPDAILVISDGKCIYVNPAAICLFGVADPSELWARNVLNLIHPNDRKIFAQRISRLEDHGGGNPLLEDNILRFDRRDDPGGSRCNQDYVPRPTCRPTAAARHHATETGRGGDQTTGGDCQQAMRPQSA